MSNKSYHTFKKNEREKIKQKKKEEKLAKKIELKKLKSETVFDKDGIDPDIADIVPGPQPRPDDL